MMSGKSDRLNNIMDCPDEVLMTIISHLNARDRVTLSKTSERLNALIFDEKTFFRDLDFSEEGFLTSESDVNQYFEHKTKLEYINKINVSSFYCTRPRDILQNIMKATNLVEANISGLKMAGFEEFAHFLEPLKQLRKLTCDWPTRSTWDTPWREYLTESFGRLTHLSVTLRGNRDKWSLFNVLELCLELEELSILQAYQTPESTRRRFWMRTLKVLKKLKRIVCCGCEVGLFLTIISDLLEDPLQWAKLWSSENSPPQTEYVYLEKDLEVAEELRDYVMLEYDMWQLDDSMGWHLRHERLLRRVLQIKNANSDELCSLSFPCSLRIEEAKLLLKNPGYQISYLNLFHNIDRYCDVYLIAPILPSLTKLVLSNIVMDGDWSDEELPLETGMKRKRSVAEELSQSECSHIPFKKLVNNTPNLQDLTVCASLLTCDREWDVASLYQIARWNNLKTLQLSHVPIVDGHFLIEIAKQCTNLEKLRLEDLGPRHACHYKDELLEMLGHCHNLKDFSIQQNNISGMSDILYALASIPKLRRVRVESLGVKRGIGKLPVSINQLVRSCNLILFICAVKAMTQPIADQLNTMLQSLKDELERPLFQFEIRLWNRSKEPLHNLDLEFAHRDLILPQQFADAIHRLDCV